MKSRAVKFSFRLVFFTAIVTMTLFLNSLFGGKASPERIPMWPAQQELPASSSNRTEPASVFVVASVRRSLPVSGTGPRGGGAAGSPHGPCGAGAPNAPRVRPNRFDMTATVYSLIALAFGMDCGTLDTHDLVVAAPGWVKSEEFTIQALIPEDSPIYTSLQLGNGEAPKLQIMLQNLLADRFRLALHREVKEVPGYTLGVAEGGPKLRPLREGSCDAAKPRMPFVASWPRNEWPCGTRFVRRDGLNVTVDAVGVGLADFSKLLAAALDRAPVIDKTRITGVFDLHLDFSAEENPSSVDGIRPENSPGISPSQRLGPSVFSAIREQLGLTLTSTKGPREALVIDRVERPTEN